MPGWATTVLSTLWQRVTRPKWLWLAAGALIAVGILLLALRLMWVVVVFPEAGVEWGPSSRWGHFGALLEGVGTLLLFFATAVAAGVAVYQWIVQRRRELALDVAKLQGEVVTALRLRYRHSAPALRPALDASLEAALIQYEGILRGLIRARPELARAARDVITASLDAAAEELALLRGHARGRP